MATLVVPKTKATRIGNAQAVVRRRRTPDDNPFFDSDATLADVQERLGGIPASRIHLHPLPGTATIRDLERLDGKTLGTCELIDGTIVEKQMGWYESLVASVLSELLAPYVRTDRLGILLGSNGVLRLFPQQARAPDVCFVSKQRLAQYKPSRSKPIDLDELLDGGQVVPGFRVSLRELFDRADQMLEDVDE